MKNFGGSPMSWIEFLNWKFSANSNDQGVYFITNVFPSGCKNQNHLKLIEVWVCMLNMYIQILICTSSRHFPANKYNK